jgi:Flp pilus assembly protein TadB
VTEKNNRNRMKIADAILLSLSAALVIIGTHLTMKLGITASYPVFMFAVALLFWYMYRRKAREEAAQNPPTETRKKNKKS